MLNDLKHLEIVPAVYGDIDITPRIAILFNNASRIRGSIAFWTLSVSHLFQIIRRTSLSPLNSRDSYLCVDISPPTNIDNLSEFVRNDVSVHLNIRRLNNEAAKYSTSPGLLHTKILLADKIDGDAELWIGSHNWTDFALHGPNTEVSVIFTLKKTASLYIEMSNLLDDIRSNYCRPFDLSKIDLYKKLQRLMMFDKTATPKNIIELEGHDVDKLEGMVINIFGTEKHDLDSLSKLGNDILLSIYDSNDSNNRYLYKARVLQSGYLSSYEPKASGIYITEQRRYAFTERRTFPYLKPVQSISQDVYERALYFGTIEILELDTRIYELEEPSESKIPLWVPPQSDPIQKRSNIPITSLNKRQRSLILVAYDDPRADKEEVSVLYEYTSREKTLIEKRESKEYKLISKKIVKKIQGTTHD